MKRHLPLLAAAPEAGSFLAVWIFNGQVFCDTLRRGGINGLERMDEHLDRWVAQPLSEYAGLNVWFVSSEDAVLALEVKTP